MTWVVCLFFLAEFRRWKSADLRRVLSSTFSTSSTSSTSSTFSSLQSTAFFDPPPTPPRRGALYIRLLPCVVRLPPSLKLRWTSASCVFFLPLPLSPPLPFSLLTFSNFQIPKFSNYTTSSHFHPKIYVIYTKSVNSCLNQ